MMNSQGQNARPDVSVVREGAGFRPHNRHPTTAKACVGAPGPYLPENLAQVDQCQKV